MIEWKETDIGNIPSNWDYGCLLDIASKEKKAIISGPFGSNISRKYFVDEGVPVIRGNNFSLNIGQRFIDNNFVYVTEDKAEDLNTWATVDDLVFTAAGTIGQVGIIAHGQNYRAYIISNKQLRVTVDSSKMLPIFAYYWFASNFMQDWIASCDTGSTIPLINLSVLKSLPVPVPPLPEQRAIASVLSSLDDKIDLLHRQNKTLEAMAETLFRQWFVEGVDEGWGEKKLKEVTDIAIGRTPPRKELQWFSTNTNDIKWISIKDLGNDGVFIHTTSEYLTKEAVETFNIPVIHKDTVVLSFKMTVGRVAITTDEMLSNEAIAHFKFNSKTPFSKEYLFLFLKNYKYETLGSTSSIVTSINSTMIKELVISIPDIDTMANFNNCVKSYFYKIEANQSQIRTLEKLRDTLLPKLMNGKVRIKV